ncbi:MAG TPA: DUF2314 domain-containing protein [Longimicrobium sp.]
MRLISRAARAFALSMALVAANACGGGERLAAQGGQPAREYDADARIVRTAAGDDAMNAAIDQARATVPQFIQRLTNAPPGLTYLGVKVRLGDPRGEGEYIWLYDVTYTDGKIAGKLVDDAQMFSGFHAGDVVRVEPREISDWMTVENGRACGGFTSRIVVAEVPAKVRAAYMAQMGIPRLPPGNAICDDGSAGTRR